MIDWSMIFLGGLLGSTHCVGMCGGMAVSLGVAAPTWVRNVARQLIYSLGRVFTYSIAGGLAAWGGARLSLSLAAWGVSPAWLSVIAGVALIGQGLGTLGFWSRPSQSAPCLASGVFRQFLFRPGFGNAFAAGMLTGFLPCGLLYAFLALAASTQRPLTGASLMALFAAGTIPLMLVVGVGASAMPARLKKSLLTLASVCVLVTGTLSVVRGVNAALSRSPVSCPFCGR